MLVTVESQTSLVQLECGGLTAALLKAQPALEQMPPESPLLDFLCRHNVDNGKVYRNLQYSLDSQSISGPHSHSLNLAEGPQDLNPSCGHCLCYSVSVTLSLLLCLCYSVSVTLSLSLSLCPPSHPQTGFLLVVLEFVLKPGWP